MTTDIWWYKSWEVDRDSSVEPGGKVKSRERDMLPVWEIKVTTKYTEGEPRYCTLRMTTSPQKLKDGLKKMALSTSIKFHEEETCMSTVPFPMCDLWQALSKLPETKR